MDFIKIDVFGHAVTLTIDRQGALTPWPCYLQEVRHFSRGL